MTTVAELAAKAAALADHTETKAGGDFEYTPPQAGLTVARFISYVELGKQKQKPYQGKPKADAEEARLTFELLHPKFNIKEIEVEGGTKKIADQISFNVSIKLGEKASFKKLFNTMARGRAEIKHMAQMLGEPFKVVVVHNEVGEGDKKKVFANLRNPDGSWTMTEAVNEDALAGTRTPINVPPALSPLRIFLWDIPQKEGWDSLYIEGTREVTNDKGEKKEVSKNWLQEKILSATNYPGSALEALLNEVADLSIDPAQAAKETATGAAQEALEALDDKAAGDAKASAEDTAGGLDELGL